MDLEPYQVMRLVQLGARDEVLRSRTIWLCASCTACSERCPREVDVAATMDALRVLARRSGCRPAEAQIALFHELFLDSVRDAGRLHELGLMVRYKLKSGDLLSDLDVGLPMMRHGKLKPVPHRIQGVEQLRAIFARVRAREAAAVRQSTGADRESAAFRQNTGADRESATFRQNTGAERESAAFRQEMGADQASEAEAGGRPTKGGRGR
jgi:heterodisulfide reductase subunit C